MKYQDILELLIETAEKKVEPHKLINALKELNLKRTVYHNYHEESLFDFGYSFEFETESGENAQVIIIEAEGDLFQSGFQINYKSSDLNNKIEQDFVKNYQLIKKHYSREQDCSYKELECYVFFNEISQCYLSKSMLNDNYNITFRVSNTETYSKHY